MERTHSTHDNGIPPSFLDDPGGCSLSFKQIGFEAKAVSTERVLSFRSCRCFCSNSEINM